MTTNYDFWENRYQTGGDRWDLGQPAPPFVDWLNSAQTPAPGRLIVLGCGRGYDALLFAQHGFEVVGVDFAPAAIAAASRLAKGQGVMATFLQRDIFDLVPEFTQQFDYVVEHTCFCAIDPTLRPAYVKLASQLLKPGGALLGVFFTHTRPGGPPYGSTAEGIEALFHHHFAIHTLMPAGRSVSARQGDEHVGHFILKADSPQPN